MTASGRYEILQTIASSERSQVHRARDVETGSLVALKTVRLATAENRAAFEREAHTLRHLRPHSGLPVVRDAFADAGQATLVTSWVQGTSLAQAVEEQGDPGLPLDRVLDWLGQAASVVDHLHAHTPPIVHADLKPSNILLTPDGRVVVIDLGSAVRATDGRTPPTTIGFRAPEIAAGEPAERPADVYGLAATAFALLSGIAPRFGLRVAWPQLDARQSARVEAGLRRGLAIDPSRRPDSAGALVALLRPARRRGWGAPTNLAVEIDSFVDRAREVPAIRRDLRSHRLVSLLGPGGVGKSRLARQVAWLARRDHPGGVWLADLGARDVASSLQDALGIPEPVADPIDAVAARIGDTPALVVLDGCESRPQDAATAAAALLARCPGLHVLATSRVPLDAAGEHRVHVAPLMVRGGRSPALRLFWERVRATNPDVAVTPTAGRAAAALCRRLDGVPLAVELAAAHAGRLGGPGLMLPSLDERPLTAILDRTTEALDAAEGSLFVRLAVFVAPLTVTDAERVCAGGDVERTEVLSLLWRLVALSLLVAEESSGELRYRMLDTVREYVLGRLSASDGEAVLRRRHAEWFADLGEELSGQITDREDRSAMLRLRDAAPELRAALDWAEANADGDLACRLGASLWKDWYRGTGAAEGAAVLRRLLERFEPDGSLRHRILTGISALASICGDYETATWAADAELHRAREAGDETAVMLALGQIGARRIRAGELREAVEVLREAAGIADRLGNARELARLLTNLGSAHRDLRELDEAMPVLERAVALAREADQRLTYADALTNLAGACYDLRRIDDARRLWEQALERYEELDAPGGAGRILHNLGLIAMDTDLERSEQLYLRALRMYRQTGERAMIATTLNNLGNVARRKSDHEQARTYLAESVGQFRAMGNRHRTAMALHNFGAVELERDDVPAAEAAFTESLQISRDLKIPAFVAYNLGALAQCAHTRGAADEARTLAQECLALAGTVDPVDPDALAAARKILTELDEGEIDRGGHRR